MSESDPVSPPRPPVKTGATKRPPRGPRLSCVAHVRKEAARLYRAARYRCELSPADANRLVPLLTLILRALEAGDLEKRIEALEQARESSTWAA